MLLLSMLSLLGIPLLAGFIGKFLALKDFVVNGEFVILAVIVIASLIESIYYFKITGNLFSKETKREKVLLTFSQKAVFVTLALLLIAVGTLPWTFSGFINDAAHVMMDNAAYTQALKEVIQ
jgi:NADH:ubiquinone oxidoreductase subunit 2 (subunit N)